MAEMYFLRSVPICFKKLRRAIQRDRDTHNEVDWKREGQREREERERERERDEKETESDREKDRERERG